MKPIFVHLPYRTLKILLVLIFLITLFGCGSFESENIDIKYKVYVPNLSESSITVIPPENSGNTETITLSKSPQCIVRVPGSDLVFALLSGGNEITKIIPSTDSVGDTFKFEIGAPNSQKNLGIIFTSDGKKAYVFTDYGPAGVAIMKISDNTFQSGINVNSTSIDRFFFSSDGGRLYCTDSTMGKIYVINTNSDSLLETIEVPKSFKRAEYNPSTGRFFITEGGVQETIKEFDPIEKTVTTIVEQTVDNVIKMTLSSDGSILYVIGNQEMVTVNMSEKIIEDRISLDYGSPSDFQFLPDSSYILIPSSGANLIMALDPETYNTEAVIDVGTNPGEMIIFN